MGRLRGTPWAAELNGDVRGMAFVPDGSLYVGGEFTVAGGQPANHIARWDGTSWHPLGQRDGRASCVVYALAFEPDGSLYAGGVVLGTAGGVTANRHRPLGWDNVAAPGQRAA